MNRLLRSRGRCGAVLLVLLPLGTGRGAVTQSKILGVGLPSTLATSGRKNSGVIYLSLEILHTSSVGFTSQDYHALASFPV